MSTPNFFVGLDVHKETITIAVFRNRDPEPMRVDRLPNEPKRLRRYFQRLSAEGSVRAFLAVTRHLRALGLSAPAILAEAPDQGLLLLEDLGDALYARVATAPGTDEAALYRAAVDVLARLQAAPPPADLPRYGAPEMAEVATLAATWYAGRPDDADALRAAVHHTLAPCFDAPPVPVLRDYHAENLLWLPDRAGIARVGLLDYQDAALGAAAYDLVSLVQDARRDVRARSAARLRCRVQPSSVS